MPRQSKLLRALHPVTMMWAVLLGGVSGAAATAVRLIFSGLQWAFTGSLGTLPAAGATLPTWRRFLTPIAGAMLAMTVLALRRRRAKRFGRDPRPFIDYVEAIREQQGRIPLLPNIWRTGSSAFSIATGAAIGREGSMIQFAAAATSKFEEVICRRLPKLDRLPASLAVACGVAGGVAISYQAPIAAIFFAIEIALGVFHFADLVPLTLASTASWLVSRSVLRPGPLYPIAAQRSFSLKTTALVALIAVLMGCVGPAYQKAVRGLGWLRKLPFALILGASLVGLISVWQPRVWGNGDEGLNLALGLPSLGIVVAPLKLLVALLLLRLLATTVSVGVGTVGGVFTPTLFAGAAIAACVARLSHSSDPVLIAIVGMGCLISAVTHAPLMATFMAIELTGEWRLFPVLLIANLAAWQVAKQLSPAALYAIATDQPKEAREADDSSVSN